MEPISDKLNKTNGENGANKIEQIKRGKKTSAADVPLARSIKFKLYLYVFIVKL